MVTWESVRPYFSPLEKWGNPLLVEWYHVHQLYMIRKYMADNGSDWPIQIHCSYEPGEHASNSFHHRGGVSRATDFHFVTDVPLVEQAIKLSYALDDLRLSDYVGVGIYPDWNSPGFHFDSRGVRKRWGHINGEYEYDVQKVKKYMEKMK